MNKHLSLILFLAILVSGCNQEELSRNESVNGKTFTASFEQNESRTYIEDGKYLRWTTGDYISLFNSNTLNQQYKFDGKTGDNSGTFSKVETTFGTGNDLNCHYAVYPYASDITITESGVITATLPAEQNYAENSFGLDANTMVAVTENTDDTFLKFKNAGGYLKLQLYGDNVTVKSITLTGNNNEKLAGAATITSVYGQDPTINMADDATGSVTLDCGEGVEIGSTTETATAFWIVIPPTTFENGFEVTITDVNDNEVTKSTSNEISIERNTIKPMPAFEVEIIPNNQIWYTSTDGNIVNPKNSGGFGATITSNTYENGKGVIKFDGNITKIPALVFSNCNSLSSIILPNSVTEIEGQAFENCSSLTNILIPNSVTFIGTYAFSGCASLSSITIPQSVSTLGDQPFRSCKSLTNIFVMEGNPVYDSRENCNAIIETETNTLIQGCNNTIIPSSITTIGKGAFSGCVSLTEIMIPKSVITIKENAFAECNSLTNITIPKSVTSIEAAAFSCSLTNIIVEQDNPIYDSRENCNAIIETETNTLIQGCSNTVIPNNVTTIGTGAFMNIRSLINIKIPNSVTTIGNLAFYNCTSLIKVEIQSSTPPTIYSSTFYNCNREIKFYVPSESVNVYKAANYWKSLNLLTE